MTPDSAMQNKEETQSGMFSVKTWMQLVANKLGSMITMGKNYEPHSSKENSFCGNQCITMETQGKIQRSIRRYITQWFGNIKGVVVEVRYFIPHSKLIVVVLIKKLKVSRGERRSRGLDQFSGGGIRNVLFPQSFSTQWHLLSFPSFLWVCYSLNNCIIALTNCLFFNHHLISLKKLYLLGLSMF